MTLLTKRPGHRALRRGRWSQSGQIYLLTTATEGRQPIFSRWEAASAAAGALSDPAQWPGGQLLCWVLMPDHWHGLLQLHDDVELASLLQRIKGASSRAVNRELGRSGNVWATGFHDHALRRDEDILSVARYVVANPVRAGLVSSIQDYPYWDAIWLSASVGAEAPPTKAEAAEGVATLLL